MDENKKVGDFFWPTIMSPFDLRKEIKSIIDRKTARKEKMNFDDEALIIEIRKILKEEFSTCVTHLNEIENAIAIILFNKNYTIETFQE